MYVHSKDIFTLPGYYRSISSRRSVLAAGVGIVSFGIAGCVSVPWFREPDGADWSASVPELGGLASPVTTEGIVAAGGSRDGRLENGQLVAFDTETGTQQWDRDLGRPTGLVAADGTVYVGEKRDSGQSRISAFDARTGSRRWRQMVSNLSSAMAVSNGTLYAANGGLAALETADGSVRGEQSHVPETDFTVVAAPDDQLAADDHAVYFGDGDGVVAISPTDGTASWSWRPTQWEATTVGPVPIDDTIYVGGGGDVVALDAADGSDRWRTPFGRGAEITGVHATDSSLLVAESTDDAPSDTFGTVYELSAEDGSERYEMRFDAPVTRAASTTATFVVGTGDGTVTWTDGASFFARPETSLPTSGFGLGAAGNQAFAQTSAGTLWALSPPE
ncbi:outer membrane protein assembly factor BamB family protein [Natrinema gari]|uniref:Pyrrolo-quinoline quinone beta-propeller repeat protein n=1 Tax=Natrinema gari JCM 14663 TaxID=1230459 RepID=L9ZCM2_9EURY|nr:PQQ-binding-like beta-propeller repeat protein [Natrinema gari]ELY82903.1 Pyrrolo-quinoline quinone beta-propeller repeat protein [Natrinema gari JCM 14663]